MEHIDRHDRGSTAVFALAAGMAIAAACWIVLAHVIAGDPSDGAWPLEVSLDLVPIVVLSIVGATVGARWAVARERADASLRESERELRAIVDGSAVGIALLDRAGSLRKVNPALCAFLGYDADELLRTDFTAITHSDDLPADLERAGRLVAGEIERYGLDKRYVRRDGTIVWGRLSASAVRDIDGTMAYGVGMVQDISAEKAADGQMRMLAAAVEHTADTVVITDPDGQIVYVNPAFERSSGYTHSEIMALSRDALVELLGSDPRDESLWAALHAGERRAATVVNRRRDGSTVEFDVVVTAVRDERGTPVLAVGVGRDVTAERQLQAQLTQAHRMEAVGQLAGGVAHDFNNLLTAIRGFVELHQADHSSLEEDDDLTETLSACDKAAHLVRQLLAFARREPSNRELLDLDAVVEAATPLLARIAGEGVELRTTLESGGAGIRADRGQLEEVLLNLAANARDAMPHGGLLTVQTRRVELDDAFVRDHPGSQIGWFGLLEVGDSGTGMDEATIDRAFEPFFTTKAPGKGTGLGLASVYGIVKQSDGLVYVDSRLGEGTRVRIYLPLVEGEVIDHSVVSAAPTVASGSETVLLVEDSEPVRAFVERCLRADGYEVLSFRAPGAAFDHAFAAGESIDVLLTDIVMPGISGLDLAERLRRDRPDLPVLLMTGHARDSDNSGPDPILRKPFTRAELNHALRRVLDEGGSRSRLT